MEGEKEKSSDRGRNKEHEYQNAVILSHQDLITKTRDRI